MKVLRKHTKHPLLILVTFIIIATPALELTVFSRSLVTTPRWAFTGSLGTARQGHTATLLKTGKVLVAGGIGDGFLSSAELYDPATGSWSYTGSLSVARYLCTATLLPDGRVLIVGGYTHNRPPDFGITSTAELYDPGSGTWSPTGSLTSNRAWHTATLLRSGKVLVAGGAGGANDIITSMSELWDPVTGTWTVTGSLTTARYGQTATLLQDGNVLIAGGSDDGDLATSLASVELYEPGAGTWTNMDSLDTTRVLHSATLLPGGKVLASGGYYWPPTSLNSAELYDPATRNWSHTGTLNGARESHTATLLASGQVLVAGGHDWDRRMNLTSAELYALSTGSWTITADLNIARFRHSATLLPSGKVLVAGGVNNSGTLESAELYDLGTVSVSGPIDDAEFFVRQHYRDFLNREPDAPGLAFWTDNITKCTDPARRPAAQTETDCIDQQMVTTSAAFFLSPEFQYTGYFVYRLYKGSLLTNVQNGAGRPPTYQEFLRDVRQVASGIIQNNQVSAAAIEANKKKFAEEFTQRAEFRSLYDPLSNFDYVERLFQTTGVNESATEKQALVDGLNNQTETRASVLQKVVDGAVVKSEGNQQFTTPYGRAFYENEFNAAFVLMEYFGYLQRDPDAAGYQHWLDKLNFYGNFIDAEMVRSFIVSPEYRARFGQP